MQNTANDYARRAIELDNMRREVKTDNCPDYLQATLNLEYHLVAAARLSRVISDTIGAKATAAGV